MATVMKKINSDTNVGDLSKQIETLRQDLSDLTQTIADMGKSKGDEVTSTAKAAISEAKNQAKDAVDTTRLQAMEVQDKVETFVAKQPASALGIAAGVGFLVGFLGARK